MSKNITIQEDGVAKQFTAKKLQTNLVNGGTQLWVPEDEAGDYANYEELSVTENGTYRPSEGNDGFSKVEVKVEPDLEDITITRNGVYKSHDKYGYGRIEVDVEGGGGDIETGTLTVTANGTYYSSDEDLDGYDEVIVNIEDAPALGDLDVTENGTYNASDEELDGYKTVNVNVALMGIDPTDNNLYEVTVDETTQELVKTKVPKEIYYATEPTKLEYYYGDRVDFNGAVVNAKYNDDSEEDVTSTSTFYLNGELIDESWGGRFEMTTRHQFGTRMYKCSVTAQILGHTVESEEWGIPEFHYFATNRYRIVTGDYWYYGLKFISADDNPIYIAAFNTSESSENEQLIAASGTEAPYGCEWGNVYNPSRSERPDDRRAFWNSGSYTYNSKTVYYAWGDTGSSAEIKDGYRPASNGLLSDYQTGIQQFYQKIAWLMVYGSEENETE